MFIVGPVINNNVANGALSLEKGRTIFMIAAFSISIVVGSLILFEGRKFTTIYVMFVFLILTRVVDVLRFEAYPDLTFIYNLMSIFGGLYICLFAFSFFKTKLVSNSFPIFLIGAGFFTFVRFPYNADIIVLYIKNTMSFQTGHVIYFNGILIVYYIILLFLVLALDTITKDNPHYYLSNTHNIDYQKFGNKR